MSVRPPRRTRNNPKDDDTVGTSRQAREDTFMAMVEAGALKGMFARAPNSKADLDALYVDMRSLGPRDLTIFRVPKEIAVRGRLSGAAFSLFVGGCPSNIRDRGQISFDGWADDPRELFQVPQIVEFCKGFLLGPDSCREDITYGQKALPFLIDEAARYEKEGPVAYRNTGQGWIVACAFPNAVYVRGSSGSSGFLRDVARQEIILNWIMGRGPRPPV